MTITYDLVINKVPEKEPREHRNINLLVLVIKIFIFYDVCFPPLCRYSHSDTPHPLSPFTLYLEQGIEFRYGNLSVFMFHVF